MAKRTFIRSLRQLILLTVLVFVAGGSYLSKVRSTSWEEPLWVTLYPIAADNQQVTKDYIENLSVKKFTSIERFMEHETSRYGVAIKRPIRIDIGLPERQTLGNIWYGKDRHKQLFHQPASPHITFIGKYPRPACPKREEPLGDETSGNSC